MGERLKRTVNLPDERDTAALGQALVAAMPAARAGWLLLLKGELGAGKTSLARSMLEALGHGGTVPSPTYTLVEPYDLPQDTVYHVDLYRIADSSELEFLGWTDLREGLLLVEWPERAPEIAADADLVVELSYAEDGRRAVVSANSARAATIVEALALNAEKP